MEALVSARAPGKVILSGEHAVVHGSTAVAAAIDLSTRVGIRLLSPTTGDEPAVVLELKDSEQVFSWPCSLLKEVIEGANSPHPSSPVPCSPATLAAISALVANENVIPEDKIRVSSGISAFLFLFCSIVGCRPAKVEITSNLPLGAGLGSSAAFCVSLSGALLALADTFCVTNQHEYWFTPAKNELELVNRWAFEGEKIIHGKPSGIDNSVSTFGNMIKYKGGELTMIKSDAPIKMLITDTRVGRNTKALVSSVSKRATRHSDAMSSIFLAIDSISKELAAIIELPAADKGAVAAREENLQELIEMNQGLLQSIGVSHSSIDMVLRTTSNRKLTSKLTGAGGGGCVLTLIPTLVASAVIEDVISELKSFGFQCYIVEVGGAGLQVCLG